MFHGVRRPDGTASGMRNRGHHGEEQHEPGLFVSGFDDLSGREGHFSSNQPTYPFFDPNFEEYLGCRCSVKSSDSCAKQIEVRHVSWIPRNGAKIL